MLNEDAAGAMTVRSSSRTSFKISIKTFRLSFRLHVRLDIHPGSEKVYMHAASGWQAAT